MYAKNWCVYAKRPFKGASHIYAYLGRYTHRVAISSARIKALSEDNVRFRTRGDDTVDLHPVEFMRRFLLHVLPVGFRKIRAINSLLDFDIPEFPSKNVVCWN